MKYRFDEIIINSLEKRAGVPGDEKNYISITDIPSKNMSITSWGVPEPFTDERLIIKKGDVLFVKREPSNHQVGISPIDGLFTGFGMVLRPQTEVITPEFLPYFIFSEVFINKASSIAVGTKYKTCNWTELKALVFDIPSIEEQNKIVAVIKEIEKLNTKYSALIDDLEKSRLSYLHELETQNSSKEYSLGSLISLQQGTEKIDNVLGHDYTTYDEMANSSKKRKPKEGSFYAYRLRTNQIITNRINFCKGAFMLIPEEYDGYITSSANFVFNINTNLVLPEYLMAAITRTSFISKLEDIELTASNWNSYFASHKLSVPSIEEQRVYLRLCEKIASGINNSKKCLDNTYRTLQSVLSEHITSC